MERVAARPVHQANVGVGVHAAVVVNSWPGDSNMSEIRATGMNALTAVVALREMRQPDAGTGGTDVAHRAIAVAETSAGQTDLAEQRGQRKARPHRLFAVGYPLQRPGHRHERANRRHPHEPAERMSSAGIWQRSLAHSASLGRRRSCPARTPRRCRRQRCSVARNSRSARFSTSNVCDSASINATSVPGTTGYQVAGTPDGRSLRTG